MPVYTLYGNSTDSVTIKIFFGGNMKYIYIGFAFLLFGNIIASIPNDLYQLAAVILGLIGCIVLAVGIYREYGSKKAALSPEADAGQVSKSADAEKIDSADTGNGGKNS